MFVSSPLTILDILLHFIYSDEYNQLDLIMYSSNILSVLL